MSDWITFPGGDKARASWATEPARATRFQHLLARAHGDRRRPECDCAHQGRRLQLVVRCRETGDKGERFHLARMPGQGTWHRAACPFHEIDPSLSGRGSYDAGVILERDDGTLAIRLEHGLRVRHVQAGGPAPAAEEHGPTTMGQASMTQLGLLHLLWERAGLTRWTPGERRRRSFWVGVRNRLMTAAGAIVAGKRPLAEQMVVLGYHDPDVAVRLDAVLRHCGQDLRVLLLGVVDELSLQDGKTGSWTRIVLDGARQVHLLVSADAERHAILTRRFPIEMGVLAKRRADRSAKVVALISVQLTYLATGRSPGYRARVHDIALMQVTGTGFIPTASSYELAVAGALMDAGRTFDKPLRFDDADMVLPDFMLLDTAHPKGTPMEVFGRTDADYRARMAEKRQHYDQAYGAGVLWSWDAASSDTWPVFPPMAEQG